MTARAWHRGGSRRSLATTWPQVAFAVIVGVMLAGRAAAPLRVIYPIAAIAVGLRLQRLSAGSYASFVIWLWFLTPLVRRIADLTAGFQEPSFVLLAPYLVSALAIIPIAEHLMGLRGPRVRLAGLNAFGVAAAGAGIGVPIGLATVATSAAVETLNWFVPLIFGWYLALSFDQLHDIERRLIGAFKWGAAAAGAYGIYQFTALPAWDVGWMQAVEMTSIGLPEPFAVRVFSTMHSPGVLGFFLMIAVVVWVAKPNASGMVGAALAGVTMLLSQVRSSWIASVLATMLVMAALRPSQQLRTAVLLGVAVVAGGAFLLTPEMSELFGSRMETMQRLGEDESALSRMAGHAAALEFVTRYPLGAGIGHNDGTVEALISMRDSVIVAVLVQFGLIGSLLYFMGLFLLLLQLWRYYRRASTVEGMALAACGIGLLAVAWLGVTNAGPLGICLWAIGGLAIADRHLARLRLAAVQAQAQRASRLRAQTAERIAG